MRPSNSLVLRFSYSHVATPIFVLPLALGLGCHGAVSDESARGNVAADTAVAQQALWSPPSIDISRSLAVTDLPTLGAKSAGGPERFTLERVLGRIAATSGLGASFGAAQLYQRLFDTNNTKAGGFVPDGQHCDDEKDAQGNPTLNGAPLECPRQEGVLADLAAHHPFCSGEHCDPYSPIAIVNRFDLAPANGQTCGQYRIVFGKGVGATPVDTAGNQDVLDRNLIIFEAVLRNPTPSKGLPGCAPVVEFWAGLSKINDFAQRAAELDRFFFKGLPGFEPAITFDNFTGNVDRFTGVQLSGQIRTNQFMFNVSTQAWQLREYTVARDCSKAHQPCGPRVLMVPPKINPDSRLFDPNNTSPAALAFRNPYTPFGFISQVSALAIRDLNLLNMNGLDPAFNGAQSTSSPNLGAQVLDDSNYNVIFDPASSFAGSIQAELTRIGSDLTPTEIVRRAQSQACAGCHELATSTAGIFGGSPNANGLGDGLTWPDATFGLIPLNAFTQTSEQILVPLANGVTCDVACTANPTTCQCAWAVSPALTDVFLPFRRDNMIAFLSRLYNGVGGWIDDPDPAPSRMKGSPDN